MQRLSRSGTRNYTGNQWKNPDFLFKNPDFLFKNPDFLWMNPDYPHHSLVTRTVSERLCVGIGSLPTNADWQCHRQCVKMMTFVPKTRNCVLKTRSFVSKTRSSLLKMMQIAVHVGGLDGELEDEAALTALFSRFGSVIAATVRVRVSIKVRNFAFKTRKFVFKTRKCVSKTKNFVLKMMDFAARGQRRQSSGLMGACELQFRSRFTGGVIAIQMPTLSIFPLKMQKEWRIAPE